MSPKTRDHIIPTGVFTYASYCSFKSVFSLPRHNQRSDVHRLSQTEKTRRGWRSQRRLSFCEAWLTTWTSRRFIASPQNKTTTHSETNTPANTLEFLVFVACVFLGCWRKPSCLWWSHNVTFAQETILTLALSCTVRFTKWKDFSSWRQELDIRFFRATVLQADDTNSPKHCPSCVAVPVCMQHPAQLKIQKHPQWDMT